MFPQLTYPEEPIAIIGTACRFPGGASSPSKLWQLLRDPYDLVREIPSNRFNVERFYHQDGIRHGTSNIKHAYTLSEDPRVFDADFFGIKPVEAAGMDPGHRLLLETTYEALESAGLPRDKVRGSNMGVFVGLMGEDYSSLAGRDIQNIPRYFASGAARSLLSNRLSYFFDLHGPSMTIDTACSSSLVALHQAVQSIRTGESNGAIVAGSNLILGPEPFLAESRLNMLSPSGRSRMWDKSGDGYARADGVGVLILKKLSDAIANRDMVECIVRETGVNQDGRTQGITTPNPKAQTDLIRETYRRAGLDLTRFSDFPQYFEAHGTGTATGDPIEAAAIHSAFFQANIERPIEKSGTSRSLYVGSLKTVMGHSEGAAGVAGVIKTSLALQNSTIPPNMLLNEINPKIAPLSARLKVPQELLAWPAVTIGSPRRASVNSFGFGGTNAHAILESFISDAVNTSEKTQGFSPIVPFTFSAMSEKSLRVMLSSYATYLQETPSISLRDLSWTLHTRRSDLAARMSISALNTLDLVSRLEAASQESSAFKSVIDSDLSDTGILGVFTGQGAQWATMGTKLLQSSRIVVDCLKRLQESLDTLPNDYKPTWSLCEELLKAKEETNIDKVRFSQPLCTAIQVALVDLLRSAGVKLAAVVGHSSGEIAAAYAAGYISAEDAIRVAYFRGHFCDLINASITGPGGAMIAIGTTPDDALELVSLPAFSGRVCIAAINSPTSVTLSGDADAIARIQLVMDDEKKFARLLRVDRAYHSHHMLPCAGPYVEALQECGIQIRTRCATSYPKWISSVIGSDADDLDPGYLKGRYWGDNMTKTVLFSAAVEDAVHSCGHFSMAIECGPHPALRSPTTDVINHACGVSIPYTTTLSRGRHDTESFADALGSLWMTLGKQAVDFDAFDEAIYGGTQAKLVKDLPSYPWDHDRSFWHESRQTRTLRNSKGPVHQLIGSVCPDQSENEIRFRHYLNVDELAWLKGHQIQGKVIFPAAGYIAAVAEAVSHLVPIEAIELLELSELFFSHALVLDDDMAVETQLSLTVLHRSKSELQAVFSFYADARNGATTLQENASGKISVILGKSSHDSLPWPSSIVDSPQWLDVGIDEFYESIGILGYNYSGNFRGISSLRRRLNEATGCIKMPMCTSQSDPPLIIHPAVLDSAIQGIILASSFPNDGALRHLHLPASIDRIRLNLMACQRLAYFPGNNLTFHSFADINREGLIGDVAICSSHDQATVIQLEGLQAVPMTTNSPKSTEARFFEYRWAPENLEEVAAHITRPEESNDQIPLHDQERVDDQHNRAFGLDTYFSEIGRLTSQLSHRFPRLDILEIGDKIGNAASHVLTQMNQAIGSYTYTMAQDDLLEIAKKRLPAHSNYINFQHFDPVDPVDASVLAGPYDLIIATALGDTALDIEHMIKNLRNLIKAGGYFIVLLPSSFASSHSELIPGTQMLQHINQSDKEASASVSSNDDWQDILRRNGLLTLDIAQRPESDSSGPLSVHVAQVIDFRVQMLRDPLAPSQQHFKLPSLTIIGGSGIASFMTNVRKHYDNIEHFRTLTDVEFDRLPALTTIVSFVDIENHSVFQSMTAAKLIALQSLFNRCRNLLWVTCGSRSRAPFKNMFIGLQRTVALEMSHLRVQSLNFMQLNDINYSIVAKKLLQLEAWGVWNDADEVNDLLWTLEPELSVRDGVVEIPRLLLDSARNKRYASKQKGLTSTIRISNTHVSINQEGSQPRVDLITPPLKLGQGPISLIYSLLRPVCFGTAGTAFMSIGRELKSKNLVIVVSDTLESVVQGSPKWSLPVPGSAPSTVNILLALYSWSVAHDILCYSVKGKPLVVFDPAPAIGESLVVIAAKEEIDLILLSTADARCSRPWRFLHPRASKRDIALMVPVNCGTFVQMRANDHLSNSIADLLPPKCKKITYSSSINDMHRSQHTVSHLTQISELLDTYMSDCLAARDRSIAVVDALEMGLNDLVLSKDLPEDKQVLVSWEKDEIVHISYKPASEYVRFLPTKTYWLVGLTGGLGISLCQWMIARGARYIALTSRNPNINPAIIRSMSSHGCAIEIFAADVTSRASLVEAYRSICATMPAIKGVVQGAMVMRDAVFTQMSLERLEAVTRPKVEGSIYLDEIFAEDTLDFLIFMSSTAYAAGHAGQSAYVMANGFMAALAASRRRRGLAASVLNVGAIRGNGYVSREMPTELQSALNRAGFSFLSEQLFHEIFAEGVLSSRPDQDANFEITTGLNLETTDGGISSWRTNPIFSHLIEKSGSMSPEVGKTAAISVTTRLKQATNEQQVMDIITDAFLSKLRNVLQLNEDKPLLGLSSDTLGIDSIVAVDIQSWFRQEMKVEISVLEIINSLTMNDLLRLVSNLYVPESLPELPVAKASDDTDGIITIAKELDVATEVMNNSEKGPGESDTDNESQSETESLVASTLSDSVDSNTNSTKTSALSETETHRVTANKMLPLSYTQSRFWFLNFFASDPTSFNITTLITLNGHIDIRKLSTALNAVAKRHESLRTVLFFDEVRKTPIQGVLPASPNFSEGPLLRMKVLLSPGDTHYIVLGYHHILMDGIGFDIFCSDLDAAYHGNLDTNDASLLQYPGYTLRQIKDYETGAWGKQLSYWKDQFADLPAPLPLMSLSHKSTRPDSMSFDSHKTNFRLEKSLEDDIASCCQRLGVNRFHFYLATFRTLLFLLTGGNAEDVCIGVADGNRKHPDTLRCLGLFLNLLPLRIRTTASQTFADALKTTRVTSDNAFANSQVPFDIILQELNVPRSPTTSPLFQAFLNYRQNVRESRNFLGCEAEGESLSVGQNTYDISLDILESRNRENLITVVMNKDIYGIGGPHMFGQSYINLLRAFAHKPNLRLQDAPVYGEQDILHAIRLGQGTRAISTWPATMVERIDTMTQLFGDRAALHHGSIKLTYDNVATRVYRIANKILEAKIDTGAYIGILQAPDVDWICSLLAVMRVGAVAVPMDSQVGLERLKLIARDCSLKLILADKPNEELGKELLLGGAETILLDVSKIDDNSAAPRPSNRAKPEKPMIITYTSGTTGIPKGIIIRHESVRNFVEFAPPRWGFEEAKETVLHQSSCAFDMALCQIMVCLGYAGTLVIMDEANRRDPDAICKSIVSHNVTFTLATPSEYLLWIRHDRDELARSGWRGAMSGGEPVTETLCREFGSLQKAELRLVNCYGPAEITFGCADHDVSYLDTHYAITGSNPLPNISVYVLGYDGRPLPVGVSGRIAIGGAGVMTGYLNQGTLTTSSLIPDAHSNTYFKSQGWSNIYLSEDRGRLDSDGRLIIEGRIEGSTQIKIGGIRIELEDIESSIVRSMTPHVCQAVVSHRKGKGGSHSDLLVAFVILSSTNPPPETASFLSQLPQRLPLPQYMRPSLALPLSSLPQTVSGKLDRKAIDALPLVDSRAGEASAETPRTSSSETEIILQQLWKDVLPGELAGRVVIATDTDFFQAGGSSLALVNLQRRIKDHVGTVIPIQTLFQHITLGGMAGIIDNEKKRQNDIGDQTIIDLDKEAEIPTWITSTAHRQDPAPQPRPKIVVLTGATGFLGKEVLRQLIADPEISTVHCIAVRKAPNTLPEFFSGPKISVHPGGLRQPRLGLSRSTADTIFAEADVLIHAAAEVSFLKSYQSLKATNVSSVWEIAALCLPRRIPIHFVSSATVSRLSGGETADPRPATTHPAPTASEDGYTAAKWVAEVFLERLSRRTGLPVVVHRPSNITGEDAPALDLVGNLMRYARKTATMPSLDGWSGYLDSISVETAARELIRHMMMTMTMTMPGQRQRQEDDEDGRSGGDVFRCVHEVGEVETNVHDLQAVMGARWGQELKVVAAGEWVDGAVQAGMDGLLGVYLRQALSRPLVLPRLSRSS